MSLKDIIEPQQTGGTITPLETEGYCLILAGGTGSRLWPFSQEGKPKQFLDIFGTGRTLLQQTYDRFASFMKPENIFISTCEQYLDLVTEQLPQLPRSQIIAEPLRRGTLASVAVGSLIIAARRNVQASIICSPADQWITNEEAFRQDIRKGMVAVTRQDILLTMGLIPTVPNTDYGYIQMGEELSPDLYRVKSFTEKPSPQYAEMFLQTDEFLWNVGLFLFNVQTILRTLIKKVPEYQVELPRMMAELSHMQEQSVPELFKMLPNLNIDMGILEGNNDVCVQKAHFGWADLGGWDSLYINNVEGGTNRFTDEHDNLVLDTDALLYQSEGNIVRLPKGHMALICGLKDYVISEENGILMICPKDDKSMMRRMRTEAGMK